MRIFSKEVVHVKKATHKGALDLHIFFQGNENFIKSFDSKDRLWEGTQQHLSSSPGLLAEYRALRKEAYDPTPEHPYPLQCKKAP